MVIDFECDTPTKEVLQATIDLIKSGKGFDKEGYFNLFGQAWAAQLGMTTEEFEEARKTMGLQKIALALSEKELDKAMTHQQFIQMLDDAGVQYACIGTAGRWATAEYNSRLAHEFKGRLIPWTRVSPHEGMPGVRKLESAVKELGIRGFEVSPFREALYPNDKKYYPFYAKCVELGIPVRITTGLHLFTDRPWDFGRPENIDEISRDFPELTIIAGLGGWPWVPELVAIARRNRNVYIDFACNRPWHMKRAGSGFEMLLQFGNTVLQDRIIFASGWGTLGLPLKQLVQEAEELTRSETVKRKWMYDNGARILQLDRF
jgi:predicted TIM-barrel fold metal-dependent hydrolase